MPKCRLTQKANKTKTPEQAYDACDYFTDEVNYLNLHKGGMMFFLYKNIYY